MQKINGMFTRKRSSSLVLVSLLIVGLEKVRIVRSFLLEWKRGSYIIIWQR
jgi:hypothetical protein